MRLKNNHCISSLKFLSVSKYFYAFSELQNDRLLFGSWRNKDLLDMNFLENHFSRKWQKTNKQANPNKQTESNLYIGFWGTTRDKLEFGENRMCLESSPNNHIEKSRCD